MSGEKKLVLFVDDEAKMLSSLQRVLRPQQERWDMRFETDPRAAIALAKELDFDVVVSDLRMPVLTGLEMISKMRETGSQGTEYLLLTGNADLASAIDAINETGVFRFLTKPCASENLVEAIEVALAAVAARQQLPGDMATAALAAMTPAVAVVDESGKVVYFNESADEVLKSHRGIVVDRNGAVFVSGTQARTEFREAVKKAAGEMDSSPKFVTVSDPDDLEPLMAVITPVGQGHAAIMFTVPGRSVPPSADSLVGLFGLTRVEAVLAQTIASGGTVEDAASNCKVTVETARTYLKRIFQKLGVRRQVDMVQLILTTPAALVRPR